MIIKLHTNGFSLMTDFHADRERFDFDSIRMADKGECEQALSSIPRSEISSQPEGFRRLAVAIALGNAYVGLLLNPRA